MIAEMTEEMIAEMTKQSNFTNKRITQRQKEPENPNEQTKNIKIPADFAGCIIGKAGSTINEIREQSGCRASVAKFTLHETNERNIRLVGTPEGIEIAINLINKEIENEREKRNDLSHEDE